jgi:anti-sigma B factor antagonist
MEGIQVSVEKTGFNNSIAVIKVGGYIDTTTSAELEHSLDALLKAGTYNIIIDLGNVDYISSAGWGIFISEIKGIREKGGDLKLVRMIPDVYEVFELLEFHYILKAFDTIEEAVADFDRGGVSGVFNKSTAGAGAPAAAGKGDGHRERASFSSGGRTQAVATETMPIPEVKPAPPNLDEKIRQVVRENPEAGTLKIKQMLNTARYGLDSKSKRLEYFRSA